MCVFKAEQFEIRILKLEFSTFKFNHLNTVILEVFTTVSLSECHWSLAGYRVNSIDAYSIVGY